MQILNDSHLGEIEFLLETVIGSQGLHPRFGAEVDVRRGVGAREAAPVGVVAKAKGQLAAAKAVAVAGDIEVAKISPKLEFSKA